MFSDPDNIPQKKQKSGDEDDFDEFATFDVKDGDHIPASQSRKKRVSVEETKEEEEEHLEEDDDGHPMSIMDKQAKKFMNFPCNSGLSGMVFSTGKLYISNNATKETKFIDEIDN